MNENTLLANAFTLRRELLQKILDETRDLDTDCGYPLSITAANYQDMFERFGIAERIVRLMPEECWNVEPEIIEGEQPADSEFEKAWNELCKQFQIFDFLCNLDILSGIGRYGILLLGISDGKRLSESVEFSDRSKYQLTYLRAFSESSVDIKQMENDVTSIRYGQPVKYGLKLENTEGMVRAESIDVHWTRVIHAAENKYESMIYGTPRMRPVYNYLLDIKKMLGGSAEMFWRGGFPGLAFEVNPERTTALTATEKTDIRAEFEDYSNHLQRYLALTGVTAKSLSTQVASPKTHFEVQLKAIGIALGIPYRLLLGSEEAKLASNQDSKVWTRRVAKRQKNYCTSTLIRPLIERLIQFGVLPKAEYKVKWPSLDELDPTDASIVLKNKVEAMSKYITTGSDALIPPIQFLTHIMGFSDEEAAEFVDASLKWSDDSISEEDV